MTQEVVKKEVNLPTDLTEQQRRCCEYLIFNEGRTTHQDAAVQAGYNVKYARQEAYRLMQNPKIQSYLAKRSAEVNRSFAVTKHNYVRRQQILSQKLVEEGKTEKAVGFENLIGKATGQFVDIHLHGKISDMTNEEKLEEIKRIKQIQNERVKALANSKE